MIAPALELERCCRRCEEITRAEAANFYYGIRLLPRDKRWAMSAVYAFARRIDDIGDDGTLSPDVQRRSLDAQRRMLATLTDAAAPLPGDDPVAVALSWACRVYALPVDALEFLIEGVEYDLDETRYETFGDLVAYCRRVAGAVGRLCVAIFADGRVSERMDALADDLGIAMQLTNIVRDIREDGEMGRVYLPAEDIARFGGLQSSELVLFEADRAAEWFDRGLALTEYLDGRSTACVLAMTGIYREILARIVADPSSVLRERVSLTTWEKAWVAARSLAAGATAGSAR